MNEYKYLVMEALERIANLHSRSVLAEMRDLLSSLEVVAMDSYRGKVSGDLSEEMKEKLSILFTEEEAEALLEDENNVRLRQKMYEYEEEGLH
jgi:ABC-type multidrug transport system ATPase subunit